jgi:hypothetical protein
MKTGMLPPMDGERVPNTNESLIGIKVGNRQEFLTVKEAVDLCTEILIQVNIVLKGV